MDALGVRVVVAPGFAVQALAFVLGGVLLGTASGLVPGLHVNALALLLAAAAPSVPGPPALVAAAMLAAGVVHSFLDVVPALALGVPDAAMAVTALPGHRLVLAGRGREALRLSALGSAGAVLLAVPLAVPVTWTMARLAPLLRAHLPVVLAATFAGLVAREHTRRARLGGLLALAASGALGLVVLPAGLDGPLPVGGALAPLFSGLFGAPVLLAAARGGGLPRQEDAAVVVPRKRVASTATAGSLAGAAVGFVPGVSSAVAATFALAVLPGRIDARGFLVATSGVNTANAVFATLALVVLREPRTGVTVAMNRAALPLNLPVLLVGVVAAAAVGAALVPRLGDRYLRAVRVLPYRGLSLATLGLLAALSAGFGGLAGLGAFLAAGVVGLVPPRMGARRVHLMGVLAVPLAV